MRGRVLLVDFQTKRFITGGDVCNNQVVLPLGLMYLSACIKKELPRCEVAVLKYLVDYQTPEELRALIAEESPAAVGIRCLTMDLDDLLEFLRDLRADDRYDGVVLVGGPVAFTHHHALAESALADCVVVGEGELVIGALIRLALEKGRGSDFTHTMRIGDKQPTDLDALPFPDYEAIDLAKYDRFMNYGYNRRRQATILTSRGCPYRCIYCHNQFGRRARLRAPERIVDEIDYLAKRYGVEDFSIVDDIFNVDYQRAMTLFEQLRRRRHGVRVYFPNGIRGDIIDRRFIEAMVDSGTILVTYAVESASPRVQALMRKNIKLPRLRKVLDATCDTGILVNAFFLFGMATETEDEALETLAFAQSCDRLNFPFVFFARYYPGTELWHLAKRHGFSDEMLAATTAEQYHGTAAYRTPTLSHEFVRELKDRFLYQVLLAPGRVDHMLATQARFFDASEVRDAVNAMLNIDLESVADLRRYVRVLHDSQGAVSGRRA